MGCKGIDNGNVHVASHFLVIPAIPFMRPARQFSQCLGGDITLLSDWDPWPSAAWAPSYVLHHLLATL